MEWKCLIIPITLVIGSSSSGFVRHIGGPGRTSMAAEKSAAEGRTLRIATVSPFPAGRPAVVDRQGQILQEAEIHTLARRADVVEACLVCTGLTDKAIRPLASMPSLRALDLRGNPLTDAAVECLRGCPSLRSLDLRGTHLTATGVKRLSAHRPEIRVLWSAASRD